MVLNVTKKTDMDADKTQEMKKERRNGMGNIFEGIEPEILQRLGWTAEAITKVEKCVERKISEGSSSAESECSEACSDQSSSYDSETEMNLELMDNFHELLLNSADTHFDGDRVRAFSCSSKAEVVKCLSNRKRRNGLADLFEALSVHQKQLFVKMIQAGPQTRQVRQVRQATGCV